MNETIREEIDLLPVFYTVRQPSRVRAFLERNPDVLEVIGRAYEEIRRFFPHQRLILEPYEITGPATELILLIDSEKSVRDAAIQLIKLDNHWWRAARKRVEGRLSICNTLC